jgi:hypothetical protein
MTLLEIKQLKTQLIAENDPTNADLIAFYDKKIPEWEEKARVKTTYAYLTTGKLPKRISVK